MNCIGYIGHCAVYSDHEVRALAFTSLIAANITVILTNWSWSRNIFQILPTSNKTVKWVVGGALVFYFWS
ncbi:MAG: hypothetical protein WCJ95_03455 [Mariniphaga sp.]